MTDLNTIRRQAEFLTLPPFASLPEELQTLFGDANKNDYQHIVATQLLLAFDEEGSDTRDGFESILGMRGHSRGKYRALYRALVEQEAGDIHNDLLRKQALKKVRKAMRHFFHIFWKCQ
jgi:hypothetical protein